MATSGCYTQDGRVLSVEGSSVRVVFESKSACGGCAARAKCGMSEASKREVVVPIAKGESYRVGDSVSISIATSSGNMSVVLAYIIPLVLLIGSLSVAVSLGVSEGFAALISLAAVGLYYIGVYICRGKLERQIKFTIENKK